MTGNEQSDETRSEELVFTEESPNAQTATLDTTIRKIDTEFIEKYSKDPEKLKRRIKAILGDSSGKEVLDKLFHEAEGALNNYKALQASQNDDATQKQVLTKANKKTKAMHAMATFELAYKFSKIEQSLFDRIESPEEQADIDVVFGALEDNFGAYLKEAGKRSSDERFAFFNKFNYSIAVVEANLTGPEEHRIDKDFLRDYCVDSKLGFSLQRLAESIVDGRLTKKSQAKDALEKIHYTLNEVEGELIAGLEGDVAEARRIEIRTNRNPHDVISKYLSVAKMLGIKGQHAYSEVLEFFELLQNYEISLERIEELEEANRQLNAEIDGLEDKVDEAHNTIDKTQEKLNAKEDQRQQSHVRYMQSSKAHKQDNKANEEKIAELEGKIKAYVSQAEESFWHLAETYDALFDEKHDHGNTQKELDRQSRQNAIRRNAIKSTSDSRRQTREELANEKAAHTVTKDNLANEKSAHEKTQEELAQEQEQGRLLNKALDATGKKLERTQSTNNKRSKLVGQYQHLTDHLQGEVATRDDMLTEAGNEISSLQEQREALVTKTQGLEQTLAERLKLYSIKVAAYGKLEQEKNATDEQLEAARAEITGLKDEIETVTEMYETELKERKAEFEAYKNDHEHSNHEVGLIEYDLRTQQNKNKDLEGKLQDRDATIQDKDGEIGDLNNQIKQKTDDYNKLEDDLKRITSEATETANSQQSQYESREAEYLARIQELEAQNGNLRQTVSDANAARDQAQTDLADYKSNHNHTDEEYNREVARADDAMKNAAKHLSDEEVRLTQKTLDEIAHYRNSLQESNERISIEQQARQNAVNDAARSTARAESEKNKRVYAEQDLAQVQAKYRDLRTEKAELEIQLIRAESQKDIAERQLKDYKQAGGDHE